jgi:phosphate transport system substrate-binding protein
MVPMPAPLRAILLWLTLATGALASEVRVVGSDLLGAEFAEALRDYARRNEIELKLELEGSRAGLNELKEARAEIALLVLPPGEAPPAAPWHSVTLAYHTAVVIVSSDLPLAQLTFAQLAGIFGTSASASLSRWGEVGLDQEWSARTISPQAMAPANALSTELFRQAVLRGAPLRGVVVQQDSTGALLRKMATDQGGIALVPAMPAGAKGLKVVPVAKGGSDVAFGPTPQNVHAGDYPLRLPVWLVIRRDAIRPTLGLLRFVLGDDVAAVLARVQLVPLPREARNQLGFDLERL